MNTVPVCNETLVRGLLVSMPPEASTNSDGTQRMNRYTSYPEWNVHLIVRGFRGPETVTVGVSSPTCPDYKQGQVPVFAKLEGRMWSKLSGERPSAGLMVSAEAVHFVDHTDFAAAIVKQREIEARSAVEKAAA